MSINKLVSIVKPGEEKTEPLTDNQHTLKRPWKCPGCKLLHAEHTYGDPGPYCTGPDNTHLSDDGNPPPDKENDLLEQVKQLKLKERSLGEAKKSRIEKLKLEVAERQDRIEQLTNKLQGPDYWRFLPVSRASKGQKARCSGWFSLNFYGTHELQRPWRFSYSTWTWRENPFSNNTAGLSARGLCGKLVIGSAITTYFLLSKCTWLIS